MRRRLLFALLALCAAVVVLLPHPGLLRAQPAPSLAPPPRGELRGVWLTLNDIKALSPEGFERLCQWLFHEHGVQHVRATLRTAWSKNLISLVFGEL